MVDDREYALVLAGGGTKGAYQVGVWKALKELGIKVKAISGASIGSINGALFLQEDQKMVEDLYENIKIGDIMEVSDQIDQEKNIFDISNLKQLASDYIENKGIANTPLKEMINKYIDMDKLYNSDIDFGIITFSVSDVKPVQKFKDEIPKEKMVDYLLASSCFPIFKPQQIGETKFVDGGVYDNIPVNMLLNKGYKNIIVADVAGIGVKRKMIDKNVYLKIISPKESLGGTFEFNHERMKYNIQLGYLDTLRSFNKLQGHMYYFWQEDFAKMLELFNLQTIHGLEEAASIYGIDVMRPYTFEEFITELNKKHTESKEKYQKLKDSLHFRKIPQLVKNLDKILDSGMVISFVTDLYLDQPMSKKFANIRKVLEGYTESAEALIELDNYFKLEME